MAQNLVSLKLSDADLTAIDAALATLEQKFAGLIGLTVEQRLRLNKMGDSSEAFCRQTINVLAQNPGIVPPSFNVVEAQADLANIDKLRPRIARLSALLEKGTDTQMALGSDTMSAALEGYALLKVSGKGAGLDSLRQQMSSRFARKSKKTAKPA
jgi:hypothetical protein